MSRTQAHEASRHSIVTEGNFEELPLGRLNAGGTQVRSLAYEWFDEYEADSGERKSVLRRWVLTGNEEYGLPGEKEQDVYVAILDLISRQGGIPSDGVISFSLYELLEIMGINHGGSAYRRLKRSLRTIARTTIESYRAFYSETLSKYISDEFQIFTIRWSEIEDPEGKRLFDHHELLLHPYFVESYKENYCGRLDPEFYWSLRRSTTKRLYRLLDRNALEKREGGTRSWEVRFDDLVGLMPLSVSRPKDVKRVLSKAHGELQKRGFLDSFEYVELGKERRRKVIAVRYRLSKKFAKRTFSKRIDLDVRQQAVVDQMRYWGLSRAGAIEAVLKRGSEHCEKWATLLHFQSNVDRGKAGGLLRSAIEGEYPWWEENAERALIGKTGLSGIPPDIVNKANEMVRGTTSAEEQETNKGASSPGTVDAENIGEQGASSNEDNKRGNDTTDEPPEVDPDAAVVWEAALEVAAERIDTPSFRMWFEGTVPTEWDGSRMEISVPNLVAKEYIESRFRKQILGGLRQRGVQNPDLVVKARDGNGDCG